MSRVYTDTIEPRKPTQDITLGITGQTVTLPGNDLRVNTVKDKGGNTLWTSDGSGNVTNVNSAFEGDLKLIQTQTISSAVANVSFTTGIDSTYDLYIFKFIEIACSAASAQFSFNASDDGGATYAVIKTSSFFDSDKNEDATAGTLQYEQADAHAQGTGYQYLGHALGGDADANASGEIHLFAPSSTTYVKQYMTTEAEYYSNSPRIIYNFCSGYMNITSAVDAIDFKMSTGNIESGTIKLYGL